MRALITGANGFLGAWLTRKIVERGDVARVLLRSSAESEVLRGLSLERVRGDITEPSSLDTAVASVDVVFHLAGIRRSPHKQDFERVNALGTRNICDAAARAGVKRLVLCGSLSASGPSTPERPKLESDPFQPYEWYGESKAESERIAFGYRDRLEVVVARPSRIIGPGDRENLAFFKLVQRGWKLVVGGRERPMSMVDVDDVVDALLLMADHEQAAGEAFFVSSAETTTLEKLQDDVARFVGASPKRLLLPPAVFYGVATAADAVSTLTGKYLPLNRKLARQLLAPAWTCSIQKARQTLGYEPKVPLSESIRRSVVWYREHGWQ